LFPSLLKKVLQHSELVFGKIDAHGATQPIVKPIGPNFLRSIDPRPGRGRFWSFWSVARDNPGLTKDQWEADLEARCWRVAALQL
jgi:hypothetical protein